MKLAETATPRCWTAEFRPGAGAALLATLKDSVRTETAVKAEVRGRLRLTSNATALISASPGRGVLPTNSRKLLTVMNALLKDF